MQKEEVLKKISEGWDLIPEHLQEKIYALNVNGDDIVFQAEYQGNINLSCSRSFQNSHGGLFRKYELSENVRIAVYSE
ncbi:MAG: hypothetical protein DRQ41_15400 [Gammaproteobacteria bacterium]|nr:MAG: hypothetical protein DRQ41_15400 [Gammaproteobacteria bacterium]